ncbi:MAG: class I SAM-dependent methyltransferase [Candidatus Krumholzibacteria bacterium]|jgi:2-polyprenyl-3-methyl-5-hydroxy-6-metoxy-1,4-benzoquinol methylase|nr:class I SAM-dependent methyltransferase [Candidatus Krumholzibacteria bacterium]MDP6669523.1 class I SAM-dependent methyltransferase [Candidatus Krumholzibacteria bacterium]MDP6797845.1 class I SAM-dependent methyltransferase [Candidatus Krumholzibacteria bacterium]MDP7022523.1 class I SAM-dependent methyltransferase [Candidatus Krumholzibacteria bacterium]
MGELSSWPSWEERYREQPVEDMPWYSTELDEDLLTALRSREISAGHILDIGTGPGTQALELARLGFEVTATDLSESAIEHCCQLPGQEDLEIDWRVDDILNSQLSPSFDFIFDRGCFHVFPPEKRSVYIRTLRVLLHSGGLLFLKTFDKKEPRPEGPQRFHPEELRELFQRDFEILGIEETVYQGKLQPPPLALFAVMRRR